MDKIDAITHFLARVPAFSHFSPPQLETLASCLARIRRSRGSSLLRQGEDSRDAYILTNGKVAIVRNTPYGVFRLAQLEPGEMFGETAFVDRLGRSGEVVAETAVELLSLTPQAFTSAAEGDQGFQIAVYWAFWKSLSNKLRRTNERLSEFFSTGAPDPRTAPEPDDGETGEFRVDLQSKRRLFEEQRLSSMEINFLATLSKEKKLTPGEVIFHDGDPGDSMYVVLDGKVMISKDIPGAGEEALAFLERGAYFGEMALIDQQPRSATAKAHDSGAVVLAIPREVLEGILKMQKVSSLRLLTILCSLAANRLRELDEKIVGFFILAGGGQARGEQ